MRCLLIDVGNTRVKYAVARGKRVGRVRFVPTDELTAPAARSLAQDETEVDASVVCSVVESATRRIRETLQGPVHEVSHLSELGFSLEGYRKPETIGNDRLANACGAAGLAGFPVIAVDFGTALTVDVVDGKGIFRGGIIAPGLSTFAGALRSAAPALPSIPPHGSPRRTIGRSTREAMSSGIAHGFTGMVREILEETVAEYRTTRGTRKSPPIIATGGDAALMAKRLDCFETVCKNLTFLGLRRIAELNT